MDHRQLTIPTIFFLASFAPNIHAFSQAQFPSSTAGNLTTFGSGTVGGGGLGTGTLSFASDGTVLSKGPVTFNGAAGSKVTGELAAKVSKANVAKALSNFAFKGLPLVGTAVALYQLYDELGFGKSPAGEPTKQTTTTPGMWRHDYTQQYKFASRDAACADIVNGLAGRVFLRYGPHMYDPPGTERCIVQGAPSEGNTYYVNMYFAATGTSVTTQQSMTRDDFEAAVAAKSGWPTSSSYASAFNAVLDSGEVVAAEPVAITGPATVTQPPSVVTTVIPPLPSVTDTSLESSSFIGTGKIGNGYRDVRVEGVTPFAGGSMVSMPTNSVTVVTPNPGSVPATSTVVTTRNYPGGTVVTTSTPTTELTYAGATVTATDNTTTKTIVKDAAGNVVTDTTSKQTPGTAAAPAPSPAPDTFDLCKTYPDIAACAKLDKVDAIPIKNKDVSVLITPDSGWGSASGTCPAPRVLALHGLNTEYSWQPMCDFATGIRGVILAVAWLIAAGTVIGMARKE